MGKWCLHASSFIVDRTVIKVAGNQDRHKSSVKFDFGLNQTTQFGLSCPWMTKISHFWTWISLKPVGQSWSNFMCSIIWVGERLHMVLGLVSMATESPHWLIMGKMMSAFSWLFLIRSFWKDHIWPWHIGLRWAIFAPLGYLYHIWAQSIGPAIQNSGRWQFIVTKSQQYRTGKFLKLSLLLHHRMCGMQWWIW